MQSGSAFQFDGPNGATLYSTIEDEEIYLGLINNVITSARHGTIPRRECFGEPGLFSALPEVDEDKMSNCHNVSAHMDLKKEICASELLANYTSLSFFWGSAQLSYSSAETIGKVG
ncbi:hypothetical protein NXS19_004278 [Fusarium pseudograminearum]|nr:hypothetical protein NXS19_004278 [Fusarium pseudograminearum]